jgi:hypothetical protein
MKTMKIRYFITLILFCSIFSCKEKNIEFNSEYFKGKWTFYKTVEKRKGVEMKPLKIRPMKYEFKENGTVIFGPNNTGRAKWKISENNKLMLGGENFLIEHIPNIESYTKMKLITTDTFHSREYTYYFERGWNEK